MAILPDEPEAPDRVDALASNHPIPISAATVAEALSPTAAEREPGWKP